jgi:hypothetical protein
MKAPLKPADEGIEGPVEPLGMGRLHGISAPKSFPYGNVSVAGQPPEYRFFA